MASPVQRNNRWFLLLLVLLFAVGICVIGYWQSYDINCGVSGRSWSWRQFPPQFVCRAL